VFSAMPIGIVMNNTATPVSIKIFKTKKFIIHAGTYADIYTILIFYQFYNY